LAFQIDFDFVQETQVGAEGFPEGLLDAPEEGEGGELGVGSLELGVGSWELGAFPGREDAGGDPKELGARGLEVDADGEGGDGGRGPELGAVSGVGEGEVPGEGRGAGVLPRQGPGPEPGPSLRIVEQLPTGIQQGVHGLNHGGLFFLAVRREVGQAALRELGAPFGQRHPVPWANHPTNPGEIRKRHRLRNIGHGPKIQGCGRGRKGEEPARRPALFS
jgi:hypothetical protein